MGSLSNPLSQNRKGPVLFVSRTLPHFRLPILEKIHEKLGGKVVLVYSSEPIPGEKATNVRISEKVPTRLLSYRSFLSLTHEGSYHPGYLRGLFSLLRELKPSAIITEGESNLFSNFFIYAYSLFFQIPYFWWGCGRVRHKPVSKLRKILKPLFGLLIRKAKGVIGYSSYACRYYSSEYGVASEKTFRACNSLLREETERQMARYLPRDLEVLRTTLGIPEGSPVILYVGALVPEKNPRLFHEIYLKLKIRFPEIRALLIGEGPLSEEMEQISSGDNTFLRLGKITQGVESYFLISDLYFMPGLGGLGLQQAMQCGLPVLASVADGTELDLIKNGENGWFMPPEAGAEDWALRATEILGDPGILSRMKQCSRKIVEEEFNSDIMIREILRALQSAGIS